MPKEDVQGTAPEPPATGIASPSGPAAGYPCQPTGRLVDVRRDVRERLGFTERLAWLEGALTEVVRGGQYLLAGVPGSCKSTLATAIALDLGLQGVRSLVLLTEESPVRLLTRSVQVTSHWSQQDAASAIGNVLCDDGVTIERLPAFLYQHVLAANGRYHGVSAIILDSVQGHGVAAGATEKYARLYEFCRLAKSAGIVTLLIGHVTKRNQIAGPRDLEHNVDAVILLRKAANLRLLFVSKNRFGPELLKGIPLLIDPVTTALRPSPHTEPVTGIARTFLGGGFGAGELQAMVSLPSHNSKPQMQAPGLPRRRVEQLLTSIAQVPGLEMADLDLSIGCLLPGDAYFRPSLGLPLCLALVSSYLRRPIPAHQLQLGEIDLTRSLRPVNTHLLTELANAMVAGDLPLPLRILCPPCAASELPRASGLEIVGCEKLDDAIKATWPDIELE